MSGPDQARIHFLRVQVILMMLFSISMLIARAAELEAMRWAGTIVSAGILVVWGGAFARMILGEDEMMQPMQLRAVAIGAGLVLFAATLWGLFERMLGVPAFPAFLLLPAFAVCYAGALYLQGIRGT